MSSPETALPRASFGCRCGQVRGTVTDTSPASVNRVICYCADCQTFAHALGRPDVLDAKGGSDIVQIAPATMTISQGGEQVAALRLSAKGIHRFHAACCGTPLGNVRGPAIPVIGIPTGAFEVDGQDLDALFGPPQGGVFGQHARGGAPAGSNGVPIRILLRILAKIIGWRLTGRGWPHPFFDRPTGRTLFPVTVLSPERREALRRQAP
jgi:hypothetical protein